MTWRQRSAKWTPATLREVIWGCQHSIDEAARNEAHARQAFNLYQPGDARLGQAMEDAPRFAAEQKHWRQYLDYFRGLLERHPELGDRPAEEAVKADMRRDVKPPNGVNGAQVIPLPNPANDIADEEIPF